MGIAMGREPIFFGLFFWSVLAGVISTIIFIISEGSSGDDDIGSLILPSLPDFIVRAIICFLINGGLYMVCELIQRNIL